MWNVEYSTIFNFRGEEWITFFFSCSSKKCYSIEGLNKNSAICFTFFEWKWKLKIQIAEHKCPSKLSKYGSKKIYITRHNTIFSGELFMEPSVLFFLLMQKKIETQPSFFSLQIQQKFNKKFSGKNINFKKITKNVFYKTLKT